VRHGSSAYCKFQKILEQETTEETEIVTIRVLRFLRFHLLMNFCIERQRRSQQCHLAPLCTLENARIPEDTCNSAKSAKSAESAMCFSLVSLLSSRSATFPRPPGTFNAISCRFLEFMIHRSLRIDGPSRCRAARLTNAGSRDRSRRQGEKTCKNRTKLETPREPRIRRGMIPRDGGMIPPDAAHLNDKSKLSQTNASPVPRHRAGGRRHKLSSRTFRRSRNRGRPSGCAGLRRPLRVDCHRSRTVPRPASGS
jgi:hypothetical protein